MSSAELGVSGIPADAPRGYYGPDGQPQFFADPAMEKVVPADRTYAAPAKNPNP